MRFLTALFILAFLTSIETVFSQVVYKCTDGSGAVVFAQTPCATNAEAVYVEDSSGGFLSPERQDRRNETTQIYESDEREFEQYHNNGGYSDRTSTKGRNLSDPNRTLDGRDKRQVKAQRERDRELDKAIRNVRGTGAVAERLRAELAIAKAENRGLSDPERARSLDKAIRNVRGTGASAERVRARLEAAKHRSISADFSNESIRPKAHTQTIPAHPIPSNKGGVYIPTGPDGSQYIAPGGGICNKEGPNLNCSGTIKPANGVVIDQHR